MKHNAAKAIKYGLKVYNDSEKMQEDLLHLNFSGTNLLMMSSGNFDGLDLDSIAQKIIKI